MKPDELFGLAIRVIAAWLVFSSLPLLLAFPFAAKPHPAKETVQALDAVSSVAATLWLPFAKLLVGMFTLRFARSVINYTYPNR